MPPAKPSNLPRVLVDADVLFAGSATSSINSASLIILRMSELTLIEALIPEQAIGEAQKNLSLKVPHALPAFNMLVQRSLKIVPNPDQTLLARYAGQADAKDLPILVTAIKEACPWLVTFNIRDFQPGNESVTVLQPSSFVSEVRYLLARLQ